MPTWKPAGVSGRNGCWHFSEEERSDIRERCRAGLESVAEIAREYGVSRSVVRRVVSSS